jgi:hypothetical protein
MIRVIGKNGSIKENNRIKLMKIYMKKIKSIFTNKVFITISSFILLIIVAIYGYISYNQQVPNVIGKETFQTSEITVSQNNIPLLNSNLSIIIYDSEGIPFGYETYTLQRTIPYFDMDNNQIIYWKVISRDGGFLPQEVKTTEQAKIFLKEGETSNQQPSNCATESFDYYNICILDNRERGIDLQKFVGTRVGMSSDELWKFIDYGSDRSAGTGPLPEEYYQRQYILNNKNYNFLVAGFDKDPFQNSDTSQLQKIYIIRDDKSFIEVPANPDGTFNFDQALEEIN